MKIWKATDFVKREIKQPPWLVPDLFPAYISMIFAWGKVGKSIMSVQLAHALTTGTDFLGYPIGAPLRVLYYTSDLPEGEWQYQLEKLQKNDGWDTIWDMPGLLSQGFRVEALRRDAIGYNLVVFDSLLSISEPADLDNPQVIRACITKLRHITSGSGIERPIWLIHHKRKGLPGVPDKMSVSAAGSFALTAGVSTLIDLTDVGIEVRGRYVRAEVKLKRGENGLWLPISTRKAKDPKDVYKLKT